MFQSKLTPVDRIRASWAMAAQDPEHLADVFYSTLFELDDTTRPLFEGNMKVQGK